MSLAMSVGIYFVCWWLAFFIVLPIGVRTHADHGTVEPGTADSAPIAPHLWIKAAAATVLSAIIFAVIYVVIAYQLIPLESVAMAL